MARILALVCDVYCGFVTFPFGILGHVWYLIVSIPDPCCLSNFTIYNMSCTMVSVFCWFTERFCGFFSRKLV